MRYCKSCNIEYETQIDHCLFCNNPLLVENEICIPTEEVGNYPAYRKIHHIRRTFLKITLFLVLLTNFICLFTNYNVTNRKLTWSIYVLASTIYGFVIINIFTHRALFLSKMIKFVVSTQLFLLVIALTIGNYHWYTDYVLPITMMVLNLYSCCYLFGRKNKIYDYSVYTIIISILGLLLGILLGTSVLATPWTIVVCMVYSGVTLLAILFFSTKAMREELHRRLYF